MTSLGYIGAGKAVRRLPYDAEVEYIGCDTHQYLRTGILCSSALKVEFKCSTHQFSSPSATGFHYGIFGDRDATVVTHDWVGYHGQSIRTVVTLLNSLDVPFDCSVDFGNRIVVKNGKVVSNSSSNPTPEYTTDYESVCLWKTNKGTLNESGLNGRCYYFRIYEKNLLVRDFIPVRFMNENMENEGAMNDKVSRQLFRNQGTGAFIIGPDI